MKIRSLFIILVAAVLPVVFIFYHSNLAVFAAQVNLPVATHPLRLSYFFVDSSYGDFQTEVSSYVNAYVILQEDWLIDQGGLTRNDSTNFNRALNSAASSGKDIILIPGCLTSSINQGISACSSDVSRGLDVAKNYWNSIDMILFDEPSLNKTAMENFINGFNSIVAGKGLSLKPIGVVFTEAQLMNNTGYQATNINEPGFETYMDPSLQNDANLVTSLNSKIDQMKVRIGNKPMLMVMQGYNRNGAWTNMDSLKSIQAPVYLKAYNDSRVKDLIVFSYARTGGTRELNPCIKTEHQRIGAAISGAAQPDSIACSGTPTTPPPVSTETPTPVVDAIPGDEGKVAYNPVDNNWLVVSASDGAIRGRVLDNDGRTVSDGVILNTGLTQSSRVRVAYSSDSGQFLAVWNNQSGGRTAHGAFVKPDGTIAGNSFEIQRSFNGELDTLIYDEGRQEFVLTWVNSNRTGYLLTIGNNGQVGPTVSITSDSVTASMELSVGQNEYCVLYVDQTSGNKIAVRSVDPVTKEVASKSILSSNTLGQISISHNSRDNSYLATWSEPPYIKGAVLSSCDASSAAYLKVKPTASKKSGPNLKAQVFDITQSSSALNSYNSRSNTFGVLVTGLFIEIDNSGNVLTTSPVFTDGADNRIQGISANTTQGTFATVATLNLSTVRFVSQLGGTTVGTTGGETTSSGGGAAFKPPIVPKIPTQGLPGFGQLIQSIFTWSLNILGIAVFVVMFYAGFKWFTAAGNTAQVNEARRLMTNAIAGAILLLSAYIILYTINPDLVGGKFTLPGISGGPSNTIPPGAGQPPPADALQKHPDQSAQVAAIKTQLVSQGVDLSGDCGAFEITKRVAWLLSDTGAGLLSKPSGANCQGYATAIIAYPDGYIYDILSDAGGNNIPQWQPDGCGATSTCADRYSPAINPTP